MRVVSGLVVKRGRASRRIDFWTRQGISLAMAIIILVGLLSIWFDNPARLGTACGFFTAGLAFPLQKKGDRGCAEQIILDIATRHAVNTAELSEEILRELEKRYFMRRSEQAACPGTHAAAERAGGAVAHYTGQPDRVHA